MSDAYETIVEIVQGIAALGDDTTFFFLCVVVGFTVSATMWRLMTRPRTLEERLAQYKAKYSKRA